MTAEFVVAAHAVVFLNHKKSYQSSEEIAENVCTNPARVRKVLAKLKKAGLVEAKASAAGGYAFVLDAKKITLYDIFQATCVHFTDVSWRSGNDCAECPISRNMEPIMDQVFDRLDEAGKKTLEVITIDQIDARIFPRGKEATS